MRSPLPAMGSPLPAMGSPMASVMKPQQKTVDDQIDADFTKASDALPLPLYVTNAVFFTLFFSVVCYLLSRWREKIRNSTPPLHIVTISEIAAIVTFFASFVYLLGFFGVGFVQFFSPRSSNDDVWGVDDEEEDVNQALLKEDTRAAPCAAAHVPSPKPKKIEIIDPISSEEDEEIGNHSILLPRIQARRHQTRRRHPPRGVTEGDRKVSPL